MTVEYVTVGEAILASERMREDGRIACHWCFVSRSFCYVWNLKEADSVGGKLILIFITELSRNLSST